MEILELYSGIGGMHWALKVSGVEGTIKAAVDINPTANSVYKHNFPHINLLNRNVQSLTPQFINKLGVNTILMSPPCQPFTRNGLQEDINDERTKSFIHVLAILPDLKVTRILIENVKGFERSKMRDLLIETLEKCGFNYQEFILTPTQIGIPNTRHRYYCLAKKPPNVFNFKTGVLKTEFPNQQNAPHCFEISKVLEQNELTPYYLTDKVLTNYLETTDIRYSTSRNTCCFTKAYGRYVKGTGSVYSDLPEITPEIFNQLSDHEPGSSAYLKLAHGLKMRFFTPREVGRLMSFPEDFTFPENTSDKQKYMLLGNSINVRVVAELIKLLQ
ncbi:tRNA (cytosine(38)-C(5))-methyltransferase [Tribolium castaneum]|uniref:DNA methyltransferase 2 n=1 Tax=Tribolium castaneum TaxID=7070 RepID=D6WXT9_TRICA|nr:PREDICTED: tRNA (cytosine-5-)-methyltransferase [Tribolium castaneum]ASA69507.1 DNA methyltransferase 2 [Tribolium castaneum]EFA09160.1 DNA methyltransferase 2 [Tribolium castaneum]|eukprot:XP_008196999.1 PREDICTED: tRNA (cytosine-5-)-methyltransferase [Tribolium castaneum]